MSSTPADRRFIRLFLLLSIGTVLSIVAMNYGVDPYLIHQWNSRSLTEKHPGRERLSAWGKTYALARLKPSVVYVGNSRTELGLPVDVAGFDGQTVFNAALSGGSLADSADMLIHAARIGRLHTVVWGLDFSSFSAEVGNTEFERELVAQGGSYRWKRLLLDMRRGLSVDMTLASLNYLLGRSGRVCMSSLALAGQRDEACVAQRISALGGTAAVMLPRLREFLRGSYPTPAAMALMNRSLDALCSNHTRTLLYINPTHAMATTALYRAGYGSDHQAWLTELTRLVDTKGRGGCNIQLYDFSGVNSVTSEAVSGASGKADMHYYWETSHYRRNVGYYVMQRMLEPGTSGVPADFGVELLPNNIKAYISQQLQRQESYLMLHPYETDLINHAIAFR